MTCKCCGRLVDNSPVRIVGRNRHFEITTPPAFMPRRSKYCEACKIAYCASYASKGYVPKACPSRFAKT